MIYLDSTAVKAWSDCREFFNLRERQNLDTVKPNIHYFFGIAIHEGIARFWAGDSQEQITQKVYDHCALYPVRMLNPKEIETWQRLTEAIPDLVAAYMDEVEYSPEHVIWTEEEFSINYCAQCGSQIAVLPGENKGNCGHEHKIILCGRLDRVMAGPRLVDVKTASEIDRDGIPWKKQYREDALLNLQFQFYDYCLTALGMQPMDCYLEVLLKPYRAKPARYQKIELPEVITESYRKRFRQQLQWKVSEIVHYVENYSGQQPWPMALGHACSTKYGSCPMAEICKFGRLPKVMEKYKTREEHLKVRQLISAESSDVQSRS